jgi:hypothetical protein
MMKNRFSSVTVVLEHDMGDDEAEALLAAIRHLRGVLSVTANVSDISDHVAQKRVRYELGQQLMAVVYPEQRKR